MQLRYISQVFISDKERDNVEEPILTWYVKNINNDYVESDTKYAGSYTKKSPLLVDFRIWNNRYGTKDVNSIKNIKLNIYFSDYEDSALLPYITISTNKSQAVMTISDGIATASFLENIKLDGKANDGTDKNNPENYIDLELKLDIPDNVSLKMYDLKNLMLEVVNE